jgi:hypothetical protein
MTSTISNRTVLFAAFSLVGMLGCAGDLALPSASGEGAVRAVSPMSQPGQIGQPTPDDPVVLVLDQFGNPVGGAEVNWTVTAGGGSTDSPRTATGVDGTATVTWTLGLGIGVQKLLARVEGAHGSPLTFTATVLF